MRDPIENVTRLQKQLNNLQLENQVLKNILDKAGLSYQNELASIRKTEKKEDFDPEQGKRIVHPKEITDRMAKLFFSFFWGRTDVYAKRNVNKNGEAAYYPQCDNFWSDNCHRKLNTHIDCKDFYGNNVTITTRDNECVIYRIRDDSGDSVLTRFEVYPGIALIYNDVHTDYISIKELVGYENILEINHCREGRIEFESSEGECLYVKKGDMAINMKAGVKSYSYFPQSHYHGVTIEIDFDKIEKNQNMIMKEMQLSPKILQDKFCNHKQCIVLHEKQEFEHLFSEIYCVPEQIKKSYYKIKVMEILLFLFALDTTKEKIENRYFNKNLVAKVKEIHQYMLNHIDEKLTIACLADKHQISATNLKKYFKEIYGLSIYAYLKEKRIQKAAELLRETNHEIGKIAGMVGYDNASKFSNSFKSIMGINPSEYKKSV